VIIISAVHISMLTDADAALYVYTHVSDASEFAYPDNFRNMCTLRRLDPAAPSSRVIDGLDWLVNDAAIMIFARYGYACQRDLSERDARRVRHDVPWIFDRTYDVIDAIAYMEYASRCIQTLNAQELATLPRIAALSADTAGMENLTLA
jgi:hypothetical protein